MAVIESDDEKLIHIFEVISKFYTVAKTIPEIKDPLRWALNQTLNITNNPTKRVLKDIEKTNLEIVKDWKTKNPNSRKIECNRETGLSRPTIDKYWNI